MPFTMVQDTFMQVPIPFQSSGREETKKPTAPIRIPTALQYFVPVPSTELSAKVHYPRFALRHLFSTAHFPPRPDEQSPASVSNIR